jgi:integrase/recombinase XerC
MSSRGIDPDLIEFLFWSREVRGHSANTVRVRFDLLQRLAVYADKELRDLTAADLLAFERAAIAGRSPQTRRSYACHVRSFFRWAVRTGVLEADPSGCLTLPMLPRLLPRPIEEDQLGVALSAARPKMRAILTLAAYAGLRAIEIAGLDWADLHRDANGSYIHVRHAKGAKDRHVEVGETVVKALQAYGVKTRGPMFLGLEGRPMDSRSISRSANRFLSILGVNATLHQLRHRYGTVGYQLSRDLRMVQEQMGHSSPQTTAGYARPSQEAATRMVAALDALGSKTPNSEACP